MTNIKRVRVVREIFYEGPADWVDATLDRMILDPTLLSQWTDGSVGFVESRVLERTEAPVTGARPSRSVFRSQVHDQEVAKPTGGALFLDYAQNGAENCS